MTLALACLLVAVTVVSGAAASAAPRTCPGGTSCLIVTIVGVDNTPRTVFVSNEELRSSPRQDLGTTDYRTRDTNGTLQNNNVLHGAVSIRSLIRNVPVNRETVTSVVVRDPATQRSSPLTPVSLADPGANGYEGGLEPAFEGTTSDDLNYVRPLLAGDPSDVNSDEVLSTLKGRPLEVTIYTGGQETSVSIDATPVPSTANEPVSFTSTVERPGRYTYAWDFGDGATSSEVDPRHEFAVAGEYSVSLAVSGAAYGQSNVLKVVVSNGDEGDGDGPTGTGPGAGPGGGAGDGPRGDGKGTSTDPNAPETGPNQDSDGKTGGAAPGPQVTDPGQGGTGETATDPGQAPQQQQQKSPAGRRTPAPGDVRGVLLEGGGSVVPLGSAETPAATAGQEPTAPTARASGGGGGGLWWGAGLLPVLLLLGAAGETGLLAALRTRLRRHG